MKKKKIGVSPPQKKGQNLVFRLFLEKKFVNSMRVKLFS